MRWRENALGQEKSWYGEITVHVNQWNTMMTFARPSSKSRRPECDMALLRVMAQP
jgi:hypothetical protein